MQVIKVLPILALLFVSCTQGPGERRAISDDEFSTICLGGPTYFASGLRYGNDYAFAPKLTDDGKPVKCNNAAR